MLVGLRAIFFPGLTTRNAKELISILSEEQATAKMHLQYYIEFIYYFSIVHFSPALADSTRPRRDFEQGPNSLVGWHRSGQKRRFLHVQYRKIVFFIVRTCRIIFTFWLKKNLLFLRMGGRYPSETCLLKRF